MTYQRLKEIGGALYVLLIVFSCLGAFIYLIYKNRDITPPEKNQLWCAQVVYFNQNKHSFDTTYSSATVFDEDSIVNFTDQNNHIWWEKDFVNNEVQKNDDDFQYNDITLKDGNRYEIFTVSEGKCQTNAIEDSIVNKLSNDNQPDNDSN